MMTDKIGQLIGIGDYVISVQSKYRGFSWVLGIVEGFTEKRVKIRFTDLEMTDRSRESTSMKSPESLIVMNEHSNIRHLESAQLLRGLV